MDGFSHTNNIDDEFFIVLSKTLGFTCYKCERLIGIVALDFEGGAAENDGFPI